MSEENKATSRSFYEQVFNQGNLLAADELLSRGAVDHNPPGPGFAPGSEGVKQVVMMFRSAFPDLRLDIEDQIVEGDKVVSRITARGTHQGELLGVPPTGKMVTVGLVDILRLDGGKIVERWGQFDALGMLQQLGAVPQPGQAG
jgi:steroid delta-isomerase-like uncharacterized protein